MYNIDEKAKAKVKTKSKAKSLINYAEVIEPETKVLDEIALLVKQLTAYEKVVALAELEFKVHRENLRKFSEETIPMRFAELGFKDITLIDGTKVEIKEDIYTSFSEENAETVFLWLRKNGYGGIIKEKLTIDFTNPDTKELQQEALLALKEKGVPYELKSAIHPQTLKAQVKNMIEEQKELPSELKVLQTKKVNIKVKKQK